ncbi:similar to Saccharomyces cerevisiae YPR106W ISR1 Predicted protein kinase, overexpression causes sensitivity to staurosporine, which is a potent inhibitor of protein kinase C [Maudiozyma barnettii]|uniref:Protein kinase domain-containing protein n=1 Tax=Maudiozyma barnettii TaxID=61262 RepID=A0A8H2VB77_9SACH|nr:putative protein kinase ISR1 [Kazachstania barnettii]CAB4252077.1 similar to Saccharomyces cerevisiae YPR106W ISR1 Predicted protein kinase, overexpression causes sensitivity to staurosporine, which is a potent inhibitor of protein kinase C [Kazachstania barnettii]CAD1778571.1 similar to Saccharomyces cerevisiae YPR106W ISR1 Predicted protein kinase, overexpression causes sensitivity to staurosporine, which is a potent inhibitor of protein kinase C [Kazachstania barnettii]
MDFTPPASPVPNLDVKKRNIERLPLSPVTPELKKFPVAGFNSIHSAKGSSHEDNLPNSSLSHLMTDLNTYNISPVNPPFENSTDTLNLLNEWTYHNIQECMLSSSIDFLQDSRMKFKSNRMLGQGSYCYICEMDTTHLEDHQRQKHFVLKFPHSRRKTRTLLNEGLILTYLHASSDGLGETYIIPFHGITYINKQHFNKLRRNEFIPALILPKLNLNLQQFIKFLKQNYSDDVELKKNIFKKLVNEMLISLNFLKLKHVIHGDIKTANIMVGTLNDTDVFSFDNFNFYLCDFTSSIIDVSSDIKLKLNNKTINPSLSTNLNLDTTLEYCPPEVIERVINKPETNGNETSVFTHDTDLYSFGLCLLSFISGNEPYSELKNFKFHNETSGPNDLYSPNSTNITSSVQHTQWLINSILRNEPIALNIFNCDDTYYTNNWSEELSLVSKILVDRISLEECISFI